MNDRLTVGVPHIWIVLTILLVFTAAGCTSKPTEKVEPLGKVFIVGLDGADWSIIDRLEAQGRLPNLARLRREGAWGVLRSQPPLLSPIVWTTIATGRRPLDHGIMGFLTVRNGKTEPVRSDERQVRAFWNSASEMGVSVGVIGWYASWPAEKVNGFLLSDRIGYHQVAGDARKENTGLVHPNTLLPEIESIREQLESGLGPASTARFFKAGSEARGQRIPIDQERLDTFVGVLRTTELYRELVPRLVDRFDPDLTAVYFEGTDSVGHLFAEFADPPLVGVDPEMARHLAPAFDRFYEYIDTVLGEIVARLDPERTTLMLVSDHGFKTGESRPRSSTRSRHGDQAPLWHRPEGILLMWGRGVREGVELPESSTYDVLPTAFRALGVPLALNLEGRPVDAAYTAELLAHPLRSVDDYEAMGRRERAEDVELPGDEVMAKLRALGYIGGSDGTGDGSPAVGTASDGQSGLPLNRYNLGVVLLNDGQRDEALEVFRALQTEAPQFPLGFLGEGLVRIQRREFAKAAATLEHAVSTGSEFPAVHAALGEAYRGLERNDEAIRSFRRALELDGSDGRTALLLGRVELQRQQFDRAEPLLEKARRFSDSSVDRAGACVGLAVVAEEKRDLDGADRLYREALQHQPDFPRALERFGNLELFRSRFEHGAELLGRLVEVTGEDGRAMALYGRALILAGRRDEARQVLRRALTEGKAPPEVRELLESLEDQPS